MALRDILVLINASERTDTRVGLACALAARHGSQVIGLRCSDPFSRVMLASDPTAGLLVGDLLGDLRAQARGETAVMEASFREHLRRIGVPGEWRYVEASAFDHAPLHARYTDLAILGQPQNTDRMVEEMLFQSGRPVLVVPHTGAFPDAGRDVLVGWNAGREATRALHDALPILEKADRVTLFAANPSGGIDGLGDMPGADIARHLARHGVKVTVREASSDTHADAELLLNTAAEIGCDLIVAGAYGHSRLREMVLGGVTRTLLRQMTVPVLFSH